MQDDEEGVETKTVKMSKTQVSLAANDAVFCDEEPVSDTESESNDSVSVVSEFSCYVKNEVDTSFASTSVFTTAYSFLRNDSLSADSIAFCDSLSDDDDEISMDYFAAANTACIEMSGYLCHCGDCPVYKEIETEVTNSTCWMNERERQSICRILQGTRRTMRPLGPQSR